MRHLLAIAASVALLVTTLSGCIDGVDPGCTSDDQCKGNRICGPDDACIAPGGVDEDDTGGQTDTGSDDTSPSDIIEEGPFDEALVYEYCGEGELRAQFAISRVRTECGSAPNTYLVIRPGVHVAQVRNFEGDFSEDGRHEASICHNSSCYEITEGNLDLLAYGRSANELAGGWDLTLPERSELPENLSGATLTGSFENSNFEYCPRTGQCS